MKLEGIKIGLGITGSFCNFFETKNVISNLRTEGADIYPIISFMTKKLDTRFFKKEEYIRMLKEESGNSIIDTIQKAEPIGPKNLVDIILVCPCTGNTLAKLANGITDTPVLMAVKGHIRNNKPVVIGVSTNDGLGASLQNIAKLINMKNIYFVPFGQDDYNAKPKSLVLDYKYIVESLIEALNGEQIQPVLSRK